MNKKLGGTGTRELELRIYRQLAQKNQKKTEQQRDITGKHACELFGKLSDQRYHKFPFTLMQSLI